ncbi:hypothetical protein ACOI22_10355 [Glaciecola sp. 2405UD65-10]|jgi:cytochrome oxidase Cu insertion factor (SCO1/SenC/PrrC family)|uniref:hypothetical protein n=1 Tax=Glaciecola sp. 2405UD65-10 TaxID=3397244 RepID=UPI003B5BBAE8
MANESNKNNLMLMIAVFVLPVLLAYFALKFEWFNEASTNKGELLQPVIEAGGLLNTSQQKWHLLYVIPASCAQSCQNAIYSIKQIYQATGKESDRVSTLFIQTEGSSNDVLSEVLALPGVELIQKSEENVNKVFNNTNINAIFITDTMHNVVLRYPTTANAEEAIMDSRNILADLRKLLKLSRIG